MSAVSNSHYPHFFNQTLTRHKSMASTSLLSHLNKHHLLPFLTWPQPKPTVPSSKPQLNINNGGSCKTTTTTTTRRILSTSTMAALLFLSTEATLSKNAAIAFDFRMTVPDQTIEEAEAGIRGHARDMLLEVKELIESRDWKDAQKALRKGAGYLKQDVYTIIQNKPGSERPALRKMYSDLFNNVTRLDYAARDEDVMRVLEYYDNIVVALDNILSRI